MVTLISSQRSPGIKVSPRFLVLNPLKHFDMLFRENGCQPENIGPGSRVLALRAGEAPGFHMDGFLVLL